LGLVVGGRLGVFLDFDDVRGFLLCVDDLVVFCIDCKGALTDEPLYDGKDESVLTSFDEWFSQVVVPEILSLLVDYHQHSNVGNSHQRIETLVEGNRGRGCFLTRKAA
jgi:hypothetical protein